jgi:DNA (cytosine-5)-methyltransferase 1
VEEFMSWGELDDNGKPKSRTAGTDYVRWVKTVCSYGYEYDFRILNSADYGAYTARKRFFGQFAADGLPISWPEPTHCKGGGVGLFHFNKWKPVREVLDFKDEGTSIFDRKKPLSEKTLVRIYTGLVKFVAGGKEAFLSKYFSGSPDSKNISIEEPAHAVTTKDHHSIVKAKFLASYYGNGDNCSSIDNPSPTLTTKDRMALINPTFIDMQYGNGTAMSIDQPAATVTTNPKFSMVTCKWHYLMNPQYMNAGGSVDAPCFTLIARMDKMPPYLIEVAGGGIGIEVYESDSPYTQKIKEFMALYGIIDIKMRMLRIDELKLIMGFPKDYTLVGTQADQKKFIGNAVEVNMAKAICRATAMAVESVLV